MKFKVTIEDQVKEFESLDEAVETIKIVASKMSITALIAKRDGNEQLREKCIKARDSIKMEVLNG
jgi:hypothetical protein